MNDYALAAAAIAFLTTVVGGYLALRYRKRIGPLAAFTAGVLVAVSLFDIMPEAFQIAQREGIMPEAVIIIVVVGFTTLFLLGLKDREHHETKVTSRTRTANGAGMMAISEIILHSFLEGVVIALGFDIDVGVGVVVSLAVIGHDLSDGVSAMTVMLDLGQSTRYSKLLLVVDALAPALGVLITMTVAVPNGVIAVTLPFIAGGFIYIGMLDLLPQALVQSGRGVAISLSGAGFACMGLLSLVR
jgi:zinc transporter ZupT